MYQKTVIFMRNKDREKPNSIVELFLLFIKIDYDRVIIYELLLLQFQNAVGFCILPKVMKYRLKTVLFRIIFVKLIL